MLSPGHRQFKAFNLGDSYVSAEARASSPCGGSELGKHHIAREHTLLLDALPAPRIGKCANGKSCADDLIETGHCKVRE